MSTDKLLAAKRGFLKRCKVDISENESDNIKKASRKGIQATAQRSRLYSRNIDHSEIVDYWSKRLAEISESYKTARSFDEFLNDVLTLKDDMNARFPDGFVNGVKGYAPEFRLAHAQKSLSVCLKHLWCMGVIPEPPMCPIDRGILLSVGINKCWTKLNCKGEYLEWKGRIEKQAEKSHCTMPVWELTEWNNN